MIVLAVLSWNVIYDSAVCAGESPIQTLFFEPMLLKQYERIRKIDAELSCGHFSDFRGIPEDWSLRLTRPINGVEKLHMEAGHGSSELTSIQELDGIIGIIRDKEPGCFSLNIVAIVSVDAVRERKVRLKTKLKL
jgi:hypothetical protein